MEIIGLKTKLIEPGDDISEKILHGARESGTEIENEDIIVVASSAVSAANNEIIDIKKVEPEKKAKKLAKESKLDEKFVQIILNESDKVLTTFNGCVLTLKDEMIRINAGVDRTNVPKGKAVILPKNPEEKAENIRKKIREKIGKEIGIVISDSHVQPLRRGTVGQSLGTSGIKEVIDCREDKDLYENKLQITLRAIGDQLATASQLIMGEADEGIPAVLFKDVEMFISKKQGIKLKIPPEDCVYGELLNLDTMKY